MEVVELIFWIDRIYKKEYYNSAKSNGVRYKFFDGFDEQTKNQITDFIFFLRKKYYFPIRLNIVFCSEDSFKHHIDNHKYYAAFYGMDDENKKTYPRISVAAKITKNNSLNDVLFTIAHEITHYYQWYFLEEDIRIDRSLEIEANKWSAYILDEYYALYKFEDIN